MLPKTDVLVIGAGIAGLSAALKCAEHAKVIILSTDRNSSSSVYAQGGIAAVSNDAQQRQAHIDDTLKVGCGLADENQVQAIVDMGSDVIAWLTEQGVAFDRDSSQSRDWPYALALEGGHQVPRVLHVADTTGRAIADVLWIKVQSHPKIEVHSYSQVRQLLCQDNQCHGAQAIDVHSGIHQRIFAKATVLATGGASGLFVRNTSPYRGLGHGMVLAKQAGCRLKDLEFVQFHPTVCHVDGHPPLLITEALRGQGACLRNDKGEAFMRFYHPDHELAPRDIVSRAIYDQIQKQALPYVLLDISHLDVGSIVKRFPMIDEMTRARGIDITQQGIPVSPAAHYSCGGIDVGNDMQTSVAGLFAIGEVACTGLHGANRMASNSLLECVAAATIARDAIVKRQPSVLPSFDAFDCLPEVSIALSREVQAISNMACDCLWDHASLVRSSESLTKAVSILTALMGRAKVLRKEAPILAAELLEAQLLLSLETVQACQKRRDSIGTHATDEKRIAL